jgi:ABC-2 type transport system ATP-binding protein
MVEIKNLTKKYGQITAVNNISFTAEKNQVLGFLGPNGAGKSTTMNMIVGYLPPTSGTILIDGIDISKNPMEAKSCIGYLPELPPLYMDMKVIEYLRFVAGIKKVPKEKRELQIDRAMSRLKITDMKNRVIKNLSKGYKQRVGFAQAIIGEPKVIILDEPTVGLDPNQVLEVRELINKLKKEHTIIFSSHILQEVSAVCDKVVIINKGELKAVDTLDNLSAGNDGKIKLRLKLEGDRYKNADILKNCMGVVSISDIYQDTDNSCSYTVLLVNEDSRKILISELNHHNIPILEIQTIKVSLEEIFVKITQGN